MTARILPAQISQGRTPIKILVTASPAQKRSQVDTETDERSAELARRLAFDQYSDVQYTKQGLPRKRQRLTHLSTEQKLARRKLKNRVAAQTARDRKKDYVTTIEGSVGVINSDNQRLLKENEALKSRSNALENENRELKACLKLFLSTSNVDKQKVLDSTSVVIKEEVGSPESAAGADPTSFNSDHPDVESDVLLQLIQQLSDATANTTCFDAKETTTTDCSITESPSGLVGSASKDMESIKEMILSDHEYSKPPASVMLVAAVDNNDEQSDIPMIVEPPSAQSIDAKLDISDILNCDQIDDGFTDELSDLLGLNGNQYDPLSPCPSYSGVSDSGDSAFSDTPSSPLSSDDGLLCDNLWDDSLSNLFPLLEDL